MKIRLRKVRPDDAPALARAWRHQAEVCAEIDPGAFVVPEDDGLGAWLVAGLAEQADPDRRLVLVADVAGAAAGFIVAAVVAPHAAPEHQMHRDLRTTSVRIEALVVDRHRWREGIATRLVVAAEDWARNRGAERITTQTQRDGPLNAFLAAKGYAPRAMLYGKPL